MKLSTQLCGLCAAGTFLVLALPGLYQQIKPVHFQAMAVQPLSGMAMLESLLLSLGGATVAGALGYLMGVILSTPQGGKSKTPAPPAAKAGSITSAPGDPPPPVAELTTTSPVPDAAASEFASPSSGEGVAAGNESVPAPDAVPRASSDDESASR